MNHKGISEERSFALTSASIKAARARRMAARRSRVLFPIAFNYTTPVNVESCTVRRKGKVIKGETDANLAAARKERQQMVNEAKRERRARRAA